jgi:hypothetical protein
MNKLFAELADAEATYNSLSTGEAQSEYEESTLGPLNDKIKGLQELID